MIDKLKEYRIGDQNTCYGHRVPNNWELMEKINELGQMLAVTRMS